MFELDAQGTPRLNDDGSPRRRTSHTLNPVPLHVFAPGHDLRLAGGQKPGLANLAATVLQLLGYAAPEDYRPSLLAD
jgi:2,3-bisphosphoglycerate-independent phosphoglycerate mutase